MQVKLGAYKKDGEGLGHDSVTGLTSQMHRKSSSDDEVIHMRGYLDAGDDCYST